MADDKVKYKIYNFSCIFAWFREHNGIFGVDYRCVGMFKEHYPDAVMIGIEEKEGV